MAVIGRASWFSPQFAPIAFIHSRVRSEYGGGLPVFVPAGAAGDLPRLGHSSLCPNGMNMMGGQAPATGRLPDAGSGIMLLVQSDKCRGFGGSAPKVRRCEMCRRPSESPTKEQGANPSEFATECRPHPHSTTNKIYDLRFMIGSVYL